MSFSLLHVDNLRFVQNHITKTKEVEMAGFNRPIWKRKDSLWVRERQIEKADEQHKRDLFESRAAGAQFTNRMN
jgi:hypothetical protein